MEPKKILLVNSDQEDIVIDYLSRANCHVIKAKSGEAALALAKHVAVDAFVLISTGDAMGRTETALNLRDIRPLSKIILVARDHSTRTQSEAVAKEIPNTEVLTLQELRDHLEGLSL